MRFGCIVSKLQSAFDSLICELTLEASKDAIGFVSSCSCNIFTIESRSTSSLFYFSPSIFRRSFAVSLLKSVHGICVGSSRIIHCPFFKSCGTSRVRGLISGVWSHKTDKSNLAREEKPDLHTEYSKVKPHHIHLSNCERMKNWLG